MGSYLIMMNLQLGCFFLLLVKYHAPPLPLFLGREADSGDNKGRAVEEGHASHV